MFLHSSTLRVCSKRCPELVLDNLDSRTGFRMYRNTVLDMFRLCRPTRWCSRDSDVANMAANSHLHTMEAPTLYKCKDCSIYFATLEAIMRHKCSKGTSGSDVHVEEEGTEQTMFTCPKCDGWFTDKGSYDIHPCAAASESEGQTSTQSSQLSDASKGKSASNNTVWCRSATLLLIAEFAKYKEKQESGYMRKKEMWNIISRTLNSKGYSFSSEQVSGRWKSVMRAYKNNKDHNSKSGNNKKSYEFDPELDELFASDPCVLPVLTRSSTKRPADLADGELPESTVESDTSPCTTGDLGNYGTSSELETGTTKKTRISRSNSSQVIDLFKTYLDDQKTKQQEEMDRRERMHRERISVMNNLIKAIENGGNSAAGNSSK